MKLSQDGEWEKVTVLTPLRRRWKVLLVTFFIGLIWFLLFNPNFWKALAELVIIFTLFGGFAIGWIGLLNKGKNDLMCPCGGEVSLSENEEKCSRCFRMVPPEFFDQ